MQGMSGNAGTKSPVDNRFMRGLPPVYDRDCELSFFLAADQWTDAFFSLYTLFMQGSLFLQPREIHRSFIDTKSHILGRGTISFSKIYFSRGSVCRGLFPAKNFFAVELGARTGFVLRTNIFFKEQKYQACTSRC